MKILKVLTGIILLLLAVKEIIRSFSMKAINFSSSLSVAYRVGEVAGILIAVAALVFGSYLVMKDVLQVKKIKN